MPSNAMNQALIIGVDPDEEHMERLEHDLYVNYGNDYRIICTQSWASVLRQLPKFQAKGIPLGLIILDAALTTADLKTIMDSVHELYPLAASALTTTYDQKEDAIIKMDVCCFDLYLIKPWADARQNFYPIIDDLLSTWTFKLQLPYDQLLVAGSRWSPLSFEIKQFLSLNQIAYKWVDLDQDAGFKSRLQDLIGAGFNVPVVLFPDQSFLVAPDMTSLAERVGLKVKAEHEFYDLIIVGAGPAGLANAVYGASEGLRTLLIEQDAPGGQAGTSSRIENYLGFPTGITGADLAQRAAAQARRFKAEIITAQEVKHLEIADPYRKVILASGKTISTYAIMIATGMTVKKLAVPDLDRFIGRGVYYGAAMSEANLYRDETICVIGGANSAGQGALYFARYARKVWIILRGASLADSGMSSYLAERLEQITTIEILPEMEVVSVAGKRYLEQVGLRHLTTKQEQSLEVKAMFIFIGSTPNSALAAGTLQQDDKGFIITGLEVDKKLASWPLTRDPFLFETSIPGIFAAGDVRYGANRRVAAAVGEGSAAVYSVHKYLETV